MRAVLAMVHTIDGMADRCTQGISGSADAGAVFRVLFLILWLLYMVIVGAPIIWSWLPTETKRSVLLTAKATLAVTVLLIFGPPSAAARVDSRILRFLDRQIVKLGEAITKLDNRIPKK